MTPFEAGYSRAPLSLLDYVEGTTSSASVDKLLSNRIDIMNHLKENLLCTQTRKSNKVNISRTDVSFNVDNWALLQL